MHTHERQEALTFIRRLAGEGIMPIKQGGLLDGPTLAVAASGWGDEQLRPYFEAANGFLEDVVGVTGMRGEYDDDGLAEELDEVVKVVGMQHDQWGGVEHDRARTPLYWLSCITEHYRVLAQSHLTDDAFLMEMRRIAALAISAALAHRHAKEQALQAVEAGLA